MNDFVVRKINNRFYLISNVNYSTFAGAQYFLDSIEIRESIIEHIKGCPVCRTEGTDFCDYLKGIQ